jgi:hypothetical protein
MMRLKCCWRSTILPPPLLLLLLSLQGGMVYSNAVTTVSPTYANEVLNGGAAGWLRSTLMRPEVKSKVGDVYFLIHASIVLNPICCLLS